MVCAVETPGDRLVNIVVPYGTKMLGKPVRKTSASFSDIKFGTFIARYAINDVGGGACEIMPLSTQVFHCLIQDRFPVKCRSTEDVGMYFWLETKMQGKQPPDNSLQSYLLFN